ncbi:uncharacterized protein LOC132548325 [Ylistrum balloti]|uniref:uncharacterized protein LOC132548325 n=1 Tax=Ylistrum balloti TaxID=509963 RepID=UPI002905A493|nr:uncharacterized protein LOC132548325 [Ylistrum balloti]
MKTSGQFSVVMTNCIGNFLFGNEMQNAAFEDWEEVVQAKHKVEMRVTNQLNRTLIQPEVRLSKGKIFNEFPVLPSGKSCDNLFYKTPWTCRGIFGMVTYLIEGTDKIVCIFFSNPLVGSNILGLQWLTLDDLEMETREEMIANFGKRQNVNAKTWKTDDIPTHYHLQGDEYIVRVVMSGSSKVALQVTLLDFNPKIERSMTVTSWIENQHKHNK